MTQAITRNAHPDYRPDIDGLRAVAILSVLVFHAFPSVLRGGFVGVDIFFVISGFLISSIIFKSLQRGNFSFAEFYANRVKRIFPALILVLIAVFALGWWTLLPSELKQLGEHMAAGAGFVQNVVLWRESGYFDAAAELKPLLHLWSLAIEEQFYLLYPVLIWGAWRLGWNVLGVLLTMALLSFGVNVAWIQIDATQTFFAPHTRFWELLAGAVLAHVEQFKRLGAPTHRALGQHLTSVSGLVLILISVTTFSRDLTFPGWWAVIPVLGSSLLILSGPGAVVNRTLLSSRPLVWVGLISYPLYLWHWPILSFAHIVESERLSTEIRLWCVILSFLLAWVTRSWVEKPLRLGRKTWVKTAGLSLVLAFVGAIGYATAIQDDLASRWPPEIREIVALEGQQSFPFTPFPRSRVCQQDGHQTLCTEVGHPTIFLWGDSHAASLYAGFNGLQRTYPDLGISQSTGCGNPPFVSLGHYTDTAWCNSPGQRYTQNQAAISAIAKTRPEIIILHARWAYSHYHTSQIEAIQKLQETISQIHAISASSKIVVLGPVPNWDSTLAHEMYNYWRNSFPHALPPVYMRSGLVPEIAAWDDFLATEVPKLGVLYLSSYKQLCNAEGCLTRVGPKATDLTAFDYGHLSPAGSLYLAQHLEPALFNLLAPGQRPSK